ncbi:hypothetical protein KSS87_011979 [Heliosperma pusillum]|nr:hypothetical protein KSS87_011979 [Heliosperma pusillum]
MATAICDYPMTFRERKHSQDFYEISTEEETPSSTFVRKDIPTPPRLPAGPIFSSRNYRRQLSECRMIPKETRDLWEELFKSGYGADVFITTQPQLTVPAHFCVLSIASPVLGKCLQDSKPNNGFRYINISGVPHGAVCAFIRFLYSSCFEEEDMKKFALHLLVLSHSFVVPRLKRVCVEYLENCWLTYENVIDVLQLARNCDAPRLTLICIRMVVRHFKTVASTEGWKVMRRVNPDLEQELLESVRKGERTRTLEERKVYLQLHEAIEALIHICNDGCSTIGPRDKMLKESQASCGFSACRGVEMLIRHFFGCKTRVPGGCAHCKRMWQLLELHSRICDEPEESCHVPLCRVFSAGTQGKLCRNYNISFGGSTGFWYNSGIWQKSGRLLEVDGAVLVLFCWNTLLLLCWCYSTGTSIYMLCTLDNIWNPYPVPPEFWYSDMLVLVGQYPVVLADFRLLVWKHDHVDCKMPLVPAAIICWLTSRRSVCLLAGGHTLLRTYLNSGSTFVGIAHRLYINTMLDLQAA